MWLQTLPFAMQSRILSFLTIEVRRFSTAHLRSIAIQIIDSSGDSGGGETERGDGFFWVIRAARNLLDAIPSHLNGSVFDGLFPKSVNKSNEEEREESEEEFDSLPCWLKNAATAATDHLLPWLPMSQCSLRRKTQGEVTRSTDKISEENDDLNDGDDLGMEDVAGLDEITLTNADNNPQTVLCPQIHKRAIDLREKLQSVDALSDSLLDIQTLCIDAIRVGGGGQRGGSMVQSVLSLIEPWELDDESGLILSSQLLGNAEMTYSNWPAHVFSATILPKLFLLNQPASRVLMASTLEFCKNYQSIVSSALLIPLLHHKEGINSPMCDVLAKVAKESLHPSHAAAFFHGLLSMDDLTGADFMCVLPCHHDMISNELVWSEWLFSLFQHILSSGIILTPDSIDRIVSAAESVGCKYSRSLKFCSFLLCLVSNSKHALKFHRLSLIGVAGKTDTFLTKSVLSKLSD